MSVSGPRILVLHALTAALFATFGWASGPAAHAQDAVPVVEPPIVLATTTSVRDSGLLDALQIFLKPTSLWILTL